MNLYILSQSVNNGYDTFDAALVCAESEAEARLIHPYGPDVGINPITLIDVWARPEDVHVTLIGVANPGVPKGVILASFNAG